jgi:hypothetical protein
MGRHWIRDPSLEKVTGLGLLVVAFVLLHDAYDGRGGKKPAILGPFLPW